jgi:hypothetical protein
MDYPNEKDLMTMNTNRYFVKNGSSKSGQNNRANDQILRQSSEVIKLFPCNDYTVFMAREKQLRLRSQGKTVALLAGWHSTAWRPSSRL